MDLDKLAKYLSALTAASAIAAITYVAGYLNYFGHLWLPALALADVLSIAWSILPVSTLVMLALWSAAPTGLAKRLMGESLLKAPRPWLHGWNETASGAALPVAMATSIIAIILISLGFAPGADPASAAKAEIWIAAAAAILLAVLMAAYCANTNLVLRRKRRVFFLAFVAVCGSYFFGLICGADVMGGDNHDLVAAENETPVCVSVVYVGARGVLTYQRNKHVSRLRPWKSISRHDPSCG